MFISNKYKKIYFSIILNAKYRIKDPEEYYEKHHIIPQGIGGKDTYRNIVFLTGREHFICHRLLLKFLKNPVHKQKMGFALTNFLRTNKNTPRSSYNK